MLQSIEHLLNERPASFTLENGLQVVYQPASDHPLVSVQAWIKTGSIHEQKLPGSGLSHFLEHMLFKETGKRGKGEIDREVQAFGGRINAYTSFDRTVYYIDGPSESLDQILDILADQTLNSTLPADEVEKEKQVILREIDMTLDDPDRRVLRNLFSTAFRNSPLRYPVIGIRSLFEQVDRADLASYYRERYQPENMVLVVCGDFIPGQLPEQVEQAFGGFSRKCLEPSLVAAEPEQLARREILDYGDFGIVRGIMGFKAPSVRDSEAPALDLVSAIIGSGHSGRLRQRLREELELVHEISASTWNPFQPGLFFIHYQADPGKAEAASAAIHAFLGEIGENGFTEQELQKAQRFALVSEIHRRKTVSGLAGRLGLLATSIGDLDYPSRYFERIHQVTPEDLRATAGRILDPNRLTVSVLMPKSSQATVANVQKRKPAERFEEKTLANGSRLFWQVDRKLPRTWFRFAACGGPMYEKAAQRGATALLATLLNRDTKSRSARQIAEDLESKGGFMMESAGSNTFSLALELMPDDQLHGLALLTDALKHPAFLETTLEREKAGQLAQIKELQDDILDFGRLRLRQHFFGQHPFATHPYGTFDSIETLTSANMVAHYAELLRGPNAVMIAAGDFDEAKILPKMESFLSALPGGLPDKFAQSPLLPAATGLIQEKMDREQAVVFQAYPDVGVSPDQSIIAELLDEIFSSMSGPLFKSVRERESLAYFVGASRMLAPRFGCFYLYAGTHPDSSGKVLQCFDKEVGRLQRGDITTDEIEAAKTSLSVNNRFSLQSPANRATKLSLNVLFGKPPMAWLDYEARLHAVSKDDIIRFANEYLHPEKCLRLVITPN